MKKIIVDVIGNDDNSNFFESSVIVLKFRPYHIRNLLLDMANHITHAATLKKEFEYVISGSSIEVDTVCPKCNSDDIIPILYGYVDEGDDATVRDKELLKADQEGRINLLGCDSTDGYQFECKACNHRWKEKLGYDWGKTSRKSSYY